MKTLSKLILAALFTLLVNTTFAHSLWIETNATGRIGQPQVAKLYFGEYAQAERDSLSKWRSDLSEFTLWLVKPDGSKEKLEVSKQGYFVQAAFTPQANGVYTLLVSHLIKDLSGTTQMEFLASANVSVGKTAVIDPTVNNNTLKVFPESGTSLKVNQPVKLKVSVKGNTKAGNTVLVFSPSGWSQELATAADGTVSFKPEWPGKYVVEAEEYAEIAGELNGHAYKALWQGATYSFDVLK